MSDASYLTPVRTWMGRYPRKGADWSPEEDKALIREYESGRYLVKEIASRHLREPVAIERRLDLLRKRAHDSRFIETRVPLGNSANMPPGDMAPFASWMGEFPRECVRWSEAEEAELLHAWREGVSERKLARKHGRREGGIVSRLIRLLGDAYRTPYERQTAKTRVPLDKLAAIRPERNWQTERETAQQAVSKIKGLFSASMWPDGRSKTPKQLKPGDIVFGRVITGPGPQHYGACGFYAAIPLTDLPPEVAQALQFGEGE